MAIDSTALINALIDGGIAPAAARVISNSIANAATPQLSRSRDFSDATPRDQLRLIDGDTRKYLLTNLDYSKEDPYQSRLDSYPGRYANDSADHPYKDSQPVQPVPPLSQSSTKGGDYISVNTAVDSNTPVATVSLKLTKTNGGHLRLNTATKSLDAIPIQIAAPQGLVTIDVAEDSSATTLSIAVRGLASKQVVLSDGSAANVLSWSDTSAATPGPIAVMPPGMVISCACTLTATGWILCDGRTVSRVTYANLFAAIGVQFGSGDGTTTFGIPDLRGYFVRGAGTNSDGTASGAFGASQSDSTKRPATALTGTTDNPGDHTHTYQRPTGQADAAQDAFPVGNNDVIRSVLNTSGAGNHTHVVTITGGGDAETRPKNIALYYYIKT